MRAFVITLAGAIGGAALAVAVIVTMANQGYMPINDRQMQVYLMQRPELAAAMLGRYQQQEEAKEKAAQTAALTNKAAFFDPKIAFVTGPADAKQTFVEFYDYDCPFCRASLPAIKKFYEANKDKVRFALIEYPIEQLHGASAVFAGKVSIAARRQPEHRVDVREEVLEAPGRRQLAVGQRAVLGATGRGRLQRSGLGGTGGRGGHEGSPREVRSGRRRRSSRHHWRGPRHRGSGPR